MDNNIVITFAKIQGIRGQLERAGCSTQALDELNVVCYGYGGDNYPLKVKYMTSEKGLVRYLISLEEYTKLQEILFP